MEKFLDGLVKSVVELQVNAAAAGGACQLSGIKIWLARKRSLCAVDFWSHGHMFSLDAHFMHCIRESLSVHSVAKCS